MNKNKTKILEPRKNKNLRPVKMLYENIANQYYYKEGELKYSLKEISENIQTSEQSELFERFKSTQVEIVTWINRGERLIADITAGLLMLRNHFYTWNFEEIPRSTISSIGAGLELIKPIKYRIIDGYLPVYDEENKDIHTIPTELEVINDHAIDFFIRRIINAIREVVVLSELLYELGQLWDIGVYMTIAQEFEMELNDFQNHISTMNDLNIFMSNTLLIEKDIEEIRQGLSDTTAQAPILQGYYTAFSDYEYRTGVFYGRPKIK